MKKSPQLSSEASPPPPRRPRRSGAAAGSPGESGNNSLEKPLKWKTKIDLDGGLNQTRTSIDVSELTEGGFVEGYAPKQPVLARHDQGNETIAESLSLDGIDDRVPVNDIEEYPFSLICFITNEFPNGVREVGTAWFGGKKTLFTAGHCVCNKRYGGYARLVSVWSPVMGNLTVKNYVTTDAWRLSANEDLDIGAIGVEQPSAYYMGFAVKDDEFLKKVKVNIYGYPADKLPMPQMWGHGNAIARVYQNMFTYVLDTVGGESGAPVFSMMKNAQGDVRPSVFGIHNYGFDKNGVGRDGSDSNACTRITADVFSVLKDWQNLFDK